MRRKSRGDREGLRRLLVLGGEDGRVEQETKFEPRRMESPKAMFRPVRPHSALLQPRQQQSQQQQHDKANNARDTHTVMRPRPQTMPSQTMQGTQVHKLQREHGQMRRSTSVTPTYIASLSDDDETEGDDDEEEERDEGEGDSVDTASWGRAPTNRQRPSSLPTRAGKNGVPSSSSSRSTASASSSQQRHRSLKRVRVAIRCRPVFPRLDFPEHNNESDMQPAVETRASSPSKSGYGQVHVYTSQHSRVSKNFSFDHVFGPESSQSKVYEVLAQPIVSDVLHGMNGAIIAYGQTGTGKTYTMGILDRVSMQESNGIIPSALQQIFDELTQEFGKQQNSCEKGRQCGCGWTVELSFLQIYLETLQDLFAPYFGNNVQEPLSMRQDPKEGFFVQGLQSVPVTSFFEALTLINLGLESRQMASTGMNAASSRSHTVLTAEITVHRCQKRMSSDSGVTTTVSRLRLVDLAGSERVRTSSRANTQVKEAQSINKSLSALGNVVAALAQRDQQGMALSTSRPSTSTTVSSSSFGTNPASRSQASVHIPFRGSQLTKILQDTLGGGAGGSNTVLVATVSPSPESCRETLSTLKFASRCMRVRSSAQIRRHESGSVDYARLCADLQQRLDLAQTEFARREAMLRKSYESRIAELARGEGSIGNHALFFDMYRTVMELETGFRKRLDEQRGSLGNFVAEQVPEGRQAKLLSVINNNTQPRRDEQLAIRVADSLGMDRSEVTKSHLTSEPLPPGTSAEELAIHARIASEALRIEADDANTLLHFVMDELLAQYAQGAKQEEDLANCSTILEFLLKTNADLRAEICAVGPADTWPQQFCQVPPSQHVPHRNRDQLQHNRVRQPLRTSQLDQYLGQ